jgi:hypothetical protein
MWNFLYSTNTRLSYILGESYYGGKHFVWCNPYFEYVTQPGLGALTVPTSTPKIIYESLALEVEFKDRHSRKIKDNKAGLLKGAAIHLKQGTITQSQYENIRYLITIAAEISDFQPLLYIINYKSVEVDLVEVPVKKLANPYCREFQIANLSRPNFEVLELPRMRV